MNMQSCNAGIVSCKKKIFFTALVFILAAVSCKKNYSAPVPGYNNWDIFTGGSPLLLSGQSRKTMEGIYDLKEGGIIFGQSVAVKWSYVVIAGDTTYHLSFFCGKDIGYIICEGKMSSGDILLNGYWRKMVSDETGIVRLIIKAQEGALLIANGNLPVKQDNIIISGVFGNGQDLPLTPFTCNYSRPLYNKKPFRILGDRAGGRNSDLLPVSENSVPMILKTAEFGSTGIEVDVRTTSDGIPIIYHDDNINTREAQKSGLLGPVKNYSYDQLSTFVRLIHGEKIPTLREALEAALYQTPLTFVWLDPKYTGGSLQSIRDLQREYLQKAAAAGRDLQIVIGLPDAATIDEFFALSDYGSTPNICELTLNDVERTNAAIWAPRFTLGTQNDEVDKIHSEGRQAFVWTINVPSIVQQYLQDGKFDAILSNYPTSVAYSYYAQ